MMNKVIIIIILIFSYATLICQVDSSPVSAWLERVKSEDLSIKNAAAYNLSEIGSDIENETEILLKSLSDENWFVRSYVAYQLGEFQLDFKKAIPKLIDLFRDPSTFVRYQASVALSKYGPKAVAPLIEALDYTSGPFYYGEAPTTSIHACISLSLIGKPAAIELYRLRNKYAKIAIDLSDLPYFYSPFTPPDSIYSDNLQVQINASFNNINKDTLKNLSFKILQNGLIKHKSKIALKYLVHLGKEGIDIIDSTLLNSNVELRRLIIKNLQHPMKYISLDRTLPLLNRAINDPDSLVRYHAVRTFRQSYYEGRGEMAIPNLINAIGDNDVKVKEKALDALSHLFSNHEIEKENYYSDEFKQNLIQIINTKEGKIKKFALRLILEFIEYSPEDISRIIQKQESEIVHYINSKILADLIEHALDYYSVEEYIALINDASVSSWHHKIYQTLALTSNLNKAKFNPLSTLTNKARPESIIKLEYHEQYWLFASIANQGDHGFAFLKDNFLNYNNETKKRILSVIERFHNNNKKALDILHLAINIDEIKYNAIELISSEFKLERIAYLSFFLDQLKEGNETEQAILNIDNEGLPKILKFIDICQDDTARKRAILISLKLNWAKSLKLKTLLYDCLQSDDFELQLSALKALREYPIGLNNELDSLQPVLIKILRSPIHELRISALQTILIFGKDAQLFLDEIIRLSDDPNYNVRINVAYDLGRIGSLSDSIVSKLDTNDRYILIHKKLGEISNEIRKINLKDDDLIVNTLISLAQDSVSQVKEVAIYFLGLFDNTSKIESILIKALEDYSPKIRAVAYQSLLNIKSTHYDNPIFLKEIYDKTISDFFRSKIRYIWDYYFDLTVSAKTIPGLPNLHWPPPPSTVRGIVPKYLLGSERDTLRTVYNNLKSALELAGYHELRTYKVENGFVVVTKFERINADASPHNDENHRWIEKEIPPLNLGDYLRNLVFGTEGNYRTIAFFVTPYAYFPDNGKPMLISSSAKSLYKKGGFDLTDDIGKLPFKNKYLHCLVYQFYKKNGGQASIIYDTEWGIKDHLTRSSIINY